MAIDWSQFQPAEPVTGGVDWSQFAPVPDFSNVDSGASSRPLMQSADDEAQRTARGIASGDIPTPNYQMGPPSPRLVSAKPMIDLPRALGNAWDAIFGNPVAKALRDNPFVRGFEGRLNEAAAGANLLTAMPVATAVDALRGDNAATDYAGQMIAQPRARAAELAAPEDASTGQKVVQALGGLAFDLPTAMASKPVEIGSALPRFLATTDTAVVKQLLGDAFKEAAMTARVPATTAGLSTALSVIDSGGTPEEAIKAGLADAGGTVGNFVLPLNIAGGIASRGLQGAAVNVVGEAAQNTVTNQFLPDELQRPLYDPEQLGISAVLGAPMAIALGERAPRSAPQTRARELTNELTVDASRIRTPESDAVDAGRETARAIFAEADAAARPDPATNVPETVLDNSPEFSNQNRARLAELEAKPEPTLFEREEMALLQEGKPFDRQALLADLESAPEPELIRNGTRVFYPGDVKAMRAKLAEAGLSEGMRMTGEDGSDAGLYFPAKMQAEVDAVLRPSKPSAPTGTEAAELDATIEAPVAAAKDAMAALQALNPQLANELRVEALSDEEMDSRPANTVSGKGAGAGRNGSVINLKKIGATFSEVKEEIRHMVDTLLGGGQVAKWIDEDAGMQRRVRDFLNGRHKLGDLAPNTRYDDGAEIAQSLLDQYFRNPDAVREALPDMATFLEQMGADKYRPVMDALAEAEKTNASREPVRARETAAPVETTPAAPYQGPAIPPPKKQRNQVRSTADFDPNYHDIRDFIALHGGLDAKAFAAEFNSEVPSPAENFRFFGKPLFRKSGGLQPDQLRELLQETGFLNPDSMDGVARYTPQDAYDLVDRALDGNPVYHSDGVATQNAIQNYNNEYADLSRRQEYIDEHGATPELDEEFARRADAMDRGDFEPVFSKRAKDRTATPSPAIKRSQQAPAESFRGMTRDEFLGNPKITKTSNAAELKPRQITSLAEIEPVPFDSGSGALTARYSPDGAAVYDGDKVIASYNFGDTLVVDKNYRKQGIGEELVYQWRTRNPNAKPAKTRTKASQKLQEKVWDRISRENGRPEGGIKRSQRPAERILPNEDMETAPLGSWVRGKKVPGVRDADLFQVMDVPFDRINAPELDSADNIAPERRLDAEDYTKRLRNGEVAPNARGYELPSGLIKLADGHRRMIAARNAGRNTLRIAVSPIDQEGVKQRLERPDTQGIEVDEATPTPEELAAFERQTAPKHPERTRPDTPIIADDNVTTGLTGIARNEDAFKHPTSKAKTLPDILRDIEPGYTASESVELGRRNVEPADTAWNIRTPDGNDVQVYQKGKTVWIDVSNLKQGQAGSRIYNAVANYAHNTKRVFVGDPAGFSEVAQKRRAEQMLSSALKFGTTDHLAPHPKQLEGNQQLGIPKLNWKDGDTAHNIRELAKVTSEVTTKEFGEIADLTYNPESKRFERPDGTEFTDADFTKLAERGRADAEAAVVAATGRNANALGPSKRALLRRSHTAGSTTLKRAVIARQLASPEGGKLAGVLAGIGERGAEYPAGKSLPNLGRVLYSKADKTAPKPSRLTDDQVKAAKADAESRVASHWGRSAVNKLKTRGRVEFITKQEVVDRGLQTMAELDGVDGFFDPESGKAYVIADSGAQSADLPGVLSHEVFHANAEQFLGTDGFKRLKEAFRKLKSRDKDIAAAYKRVPSDTSAAHVDEEGLAYLAQEAPKHRLSERLTDEAKLFLNRLGIPLDWLNAHSAAVRKIAALNLKDAANRGGVVRFDKDGIVAKAQEPKAAKSEKAPIPESKPKPKVTGARPEELIEVRKQISSFRTLIKCLGG